MNTNKNAYEIRLEVLSLAHGDLMNIFHEKLHNTRKRMVDDGNGWVEDKIDDSVIQSLLPKTEDIIKRAQELYAFVEGK